MTITAAYPKWLQEVDRYLPVKKLFLLYGNIYDRVPYPLGMDASGKNQGYEYPSLNDGLKAEFFKRGYTSIGFYDIVDGLTVIRKDNGVEQKHNVQKRLDEALDVIRADLAKEEPVIFVVNYGSRLCQAPSQLDSDENKVFLKFLKCAQGARSLWKGGANFYNALFLVCDKINDVPAWLYLNNPEAKTLCIEKPSLDERKRFLEKNFSAFEGGRSIVDDDREKGTTLMADLTDGLCVVEISSLIEVSKRGAISIVNDHNELDEKHVKDIIDRYKYGITETPWQKEDLREKLKNAETVFKNRVKGQERAIQDVLDIVKRASLGLSGVQHSSSASKPKGILFFAGPTGVGKTELAKSLAEVLFGHEHACIRFDMSEYSLEQSDQRLLGAPPGYVGYQEGGQLTNKIKEHPFSVLLFDEIEKAHPSILDKFLQILEDGRMTDGKGETVYFSESVIIFTSNIGTYTDEDLGNGRTVRRVNIHPLAWYCEKCSWIDVSGGSPGQCGTSECGNTDIKQIETPYHVVRKRIMDAINEHFKFRMGRPELLNRFGDNFVVFDYVRPPIMRQIIEKILGHIQNEVSTKHEVVISFDEKVVQWLLERASNNLEQGGRGVGNLIEKVVVNPLARRLFDEISAKGQTMTVKEIIEEKLEAGEKYSLRIE